MRKHDLEAVVRGLAPVLRDYMAVLLAKDRGLDGGPGPEGKEGKPGRDGQPGIPGRDGKVGEKGTDGVHGQIGAAGRDGTLEGATFEQVDERTGRLLRADGSELGRMTFAVPLYRGVYVAGTAYLKGDSVTFGGSLWIAREVTNAKPGDGATAWQLAVKAGREGREGKPGKDGGPGPKGEPGAPGRDYR